MKEYRERADAFKAQGLTWDGRPKKKRKAALRPCPRCGKTERAPGTGRCLPCSRAYRDAIANDAVLRERRRAKDRAATAAGKNRKKRVHELAPDQRESLRRAGRAKYAKKTAEIKQRVATYRQKYPEKIRTRNANQKAARKGAIGKHTAHEWESLLSSYHGLCVYCLEPASTRDHVVPIAKGGSNSIENIVPSCPTCNSSKNDTGVLVWMARRG